MRDDLISQYGAIRETIRTNIQTIGRLIEQAQTLKNIVEQVGDSEVKASLEKEVIEIEETIKSLINQTDRLFDSYDEFVKTVFEQK